MTKIIFLDIDGVLINRDCYGPARPRPARAHEDCVRELNRIIRETGAGIVVSSAHRLGQTRVQICEKLHGWGVEATVIDLTPRLLRRVKGGHPGETANEDRGREIQAWLDDWPEPVESFVILDDDADMCHLLPRLVRSETAVGLTAAEADRAIAMLNSTSVPPQT